MTHSSTLGVSCGAKSTARNGCATQEQSSVLAPRAVEKLRRECTTRGVVGVGERTQEVVENVEARRKAARTDRRKQGVNREKRGCKS